MLPEESDQWTSSGGHNFQFLATDSEMARWLTECLPTKYAPYYLIGSKHAESGDTVVRRPFRYEVSDFLQRLKEAGVGGFLGYLWSPAITQDLELGRDYTIEEFFDGVCSSRGLIRLRHAAHSGDVILTSWIAMIGQIRNASTGEVRRFTEYLEVCGALIKEIKKALRYSTIHRTRDGDEFEDTTGILMTEDAARAYHEGLRFFRAPGRLLEKKPRRKPRSSASVARRSLEASWQYLSERGIPAPEDSDGNPLILDHMPNYEDDELGLQFFEDELDGEDLANLTIPRTFFGHSQIKSVSFRNTDLHESRMCWNDWLECNFSDADLTGADLRGSQYVECSFARADLARADLRRSVFDRCDFTDARMQGARLTHRQREDLQLSTAQRREIDWAEDEGPEPPGG